MKTRIHQAGYSLMELMIVLALVGLFAVKATMVFETVFDHSSEQTQAVSVEEHARHAIDRISQAIMGAEAATLFPQFDAPFYASDIRYRISLGVEDGVKQWSDIEQIEVAPGAQQLTWKQRPGEIDERRVVWSNMVQPLLEGELDNDDDDNGNMLEDELGLTFVVDETLQTVTIRLTVGQTNEDGEPVLSTFESVVTCRN